MTHDELNNRIEQFNCLELPGQPMSMHMGTSYLVNDLWKEILRLRAAGEADEFEALKKKNATIASAGNVLRDAVRDFNAVATFRENDDLCYHCGTDENHMHKPTCQFIVLQNALLRAVDAWQLVAK
jgi:hypothetical protein